MKVRLNKPIGNNPKDAVVDVPDGRAVYWLKIGVARHYRPASKVEEKPVEEVKEPKKEKAVKKSASKEKVQINKPPSKKRIKKPGQAD